MADDAPCRDASNLHEMFYQFNGVLAGFHIVAIFIYANFNINRVPVAGIMDRVIPAIFNANGIRAVRMFRCLVNAVRASIVLYGSA